MLFYYINLQLTLLFLPAAINLVHMQGEIRSFATIYLLDIAEITYQLLCSLDFSKDTF